MIGVIVPVMEFLLEKLLASMLKSAMRERLIASSAHASQSGY
jgi:hypothetical protein